MLQSKFVPESKSFPMPEKREQSWMGISLFGNASHRLMDALRNRRKEAESKKTAEGPFRRRAPLAERLSGGVSGAEKRGSPGSPFFKRAYFW